VFLYADNYENENNGMGAIFVFADDNGYEEAVNRVMKR
jgi:hypothetical protein